MELQKPRKDAYTPDHNKPIKFKVDCNSAIDKDVKIKDIIKNASNENVVLLEALFNSNEEIIIKVGNNIDSIKKEYEMSLSLKTIPNFIRFYCKTECNENLVDILNSPNLTHLCKESSRKKTKVGVVLMPFYKHGRVDSIVWKKDTFDILKNILTHICFSLMYAYEQIGFVHNDEHFGNFLLRITQKPSITYGIHNVKTHGLLPIILDFERSFIAPNKADFYLSIQKILNLACNMDKSDLVLEYDYNRLRQMLQKNTIIKSEDYAIVAEIIQTMKIRYLKSELPKFPW
jgi:hypothetical protein